MIRPAGERSRLNSILDALATRVGIGAVVGLLVAFCFGAGAYVQSVGTSMERNHEIFKDAQVRNGYVAMSDINRLVLVAQGAAIAGEMSPQMAQDFVNAADILWVRVDNLEMVRRRGVQFVSGQTSIVALNKIIEIADEAINKNFPDPVTLAANLIAAAEDARLNLVMFLDDMRRQGDIVLEEQSLAVRKQRAIVFANLAGLTLVGSVALSLLRREVLARRARESAEERVAFLAYFDPLTKLPNRIQFQEQLQDLLNQGKPIALLYIDLDDFKVVNDTYGHAAGDAVLRDVANVIAEHGGRHNALVARLAGDEFAMAVPSHDLDRLTVLCEELIAEASQPIEFEGEILRSGLSIGLATSTQVSAQMTVSVELMSRVTDFALYASKSNGRNQFTVYDHELEQRFLERRAMVEELPKAIEGGGLEVHLQPKVELLDAGVYGFEALVRWHRDGQVVFPGDFILIAEECGLVVDIDRYVLNNATKVIAEWNRDHGTAYAISVNLSALHFNSLRIIDWVREALKQSALPAGLLTLEITETVELRDWNQARTVISGLHRLGCRIAIDDFGTGFSSLAYLRTTQAEELKIDRSLVEELETSQEARLLLSSVFEIARNLKLDVVVEGIETEAQSQIVHGMGAPYGQGYLFGRPMPALKALAVASRDNGSGIPVPKAAVALR